jgi:hypothetical protein
MTYEAFPGEYAQIRAEYADYQRRASNIHDWAQAQYAAGTMTEAQIKRRVDAMYDALDADYMGPCIERVQTRADVDANDDGPYPGWASMQSAMRDSW